MKLVTFTVAVAGGLTTSDTIEEAVKVISGKEYDMERAFPVDIHVTTVPDQIKRLKELIFKY